MNAKAAAKARKCSILEAAKHYRACFGKRWKEVLHNVIVLRYSF